MRSRTTILARFGLVLAVVLGLSQGISAQSSVQRIAAIVNDEVISEYDVEQRLRLVVTTSGVEPGPNEFERLRNQILDGLVDERLQLQEAERLGIEVTQQDLDAAVSYIEEQNNMSQGGLADALTSRGATIESLYMQLRAQIAWSKVVGQTLRPRVVVGEDEIATMVQRMKAADTRTEHLASEIFLPFDEGRRTREEITQDAAALARQIRQGASFSVIAQQFSESVTAADGGDLGWIASAELPEGVGAVLDALPVGAVSDPIATREGIYILEVRDRRQQAGVDPRKATVALKQIFVPLSPEADDRTVESQMALARTIEGTVRGCDDFAELADEMASSESGDLGRVTIGDTPEQFQETLIALEIGAPSAPIRTERGIHVLMVCDRSAPEAQAPDRGAIENSIGQVRLSMMARRYLRDLRRDAVVEYR